MGDGGGGDRGSAVMGGGGDRGSAVMGGGRDACVGSGGVNERDSCRIPGVIQELWEDLHTVSCFFSNSWPMKGVVGVGDVTLVKSQKSISSMSLVSISRFSSVTL